PVANATAPVANATAPVANATAPVANATAPVANATAPVANATAPVANATAPVANATVEEEAVVEEAAAEIVLDAMDKYLPEACSNGFFKRDKNIQMKVCNKLAHELKCNQGIEHFDDLADNNEFANRMNEYSPIVGKLEEIYNHIEC
ncbi:MAG: hypothetical protein K0T99_02025, partial [Alphaproteobacteria bacterium]|nr:hypothetical protein [Alphaproteobacteria bacterium]